MPQTYKVILAGPAASGKTTLRNYLEMRPPQLNYTPSNGVNFTTYNLDFDKQLQIWELPGQEQLAVNNSIYYNGANAILITCDLTDSNFDANIKHFLETNKKHFPKGVPIFLMSIKFDDSYQNQLKSKAQLKSIAKNNSLDIPDEHIVLCGALTGVSILRLFNELIPSILPTKVELEKKQQTKAETKKKQQDPEQKKNFDFQQTIKLVLQHIRTSRLYRHIKQNPWRYGLGLLLMLSAIALFAIPGFAAAIGLGAAISGATFATATTLGITLIGAKALLGVSAGIMAFLTAQLVGYLGSKAAQTTKKKYWRKSMEAPFVQQKSQTFSYTPPANNMTGKAISEENSKLTPINEKSGSKSFCFRFC